MRALLPVLVGALLMPGAVAAATLIEMSASGEQVNLVIDRPSNGC